MLFDDPALRQLKNTFEKEKVKKEGLLKPQIEALDS